MLHLIYDAETTGMWNYKLPVDHASQPRLVQMGAILADDEARVMAEINLIVKPDGFTIPEDVSKNVHGITTEMAMRVGMPNLLVMGAFSNLVAVADIAIAFNNEYDRSIVSRETLLLGKPNRLEEERIKHHCLMKFMAPICKIPKPPGYTRNPDDMWKWPSLDQAYEHVFNEKFKGTRHNAMEDVRAAGRLYYAFFWKSRETGTQLMPGVANTEPTKQQSLL